MAATFTKLYLTTLAATFTPATIRGAWDDTAGAVTKQLSPVKTRADAITSVARAETNVSTTWDVLLYRGISGPLAAQTISGTIQLLLGILESSASADFNWHVHVYVTSGDTDTPRGTLLTDYTEAAGTNEWPTTATGKQLNAAQTLSSLAISAGDRLVVEIGYIARNSVTTSFTGTLAYGTQNAQGLDAPDLTNGSTATATQAGFISFSNAITEAAVEGDVSQFALDIATAGPAPAGVSQFALDVATAGRAPAGVSQWVLDVLTGSSVPALVSQWAWDVLTKAPDIVEYEPPIGDSFGPILWYEFDSSDGVTRAWAMTELADPASYYHGFKDGIVLQAGTVIRSLSSDDDGTLEGQRSSVQVSDVSRYLRGLLGQHDARRHFINKPLRLRMIDDASRRAQLTPRTVAMAVVRDYSTAN